MKRISASLAMLALLLFPVTVVSAADPAVAVSITGASLVAKGVAVDVTLDVVCQPIDGNVNLRMDMGTSVGVDQAIGRKAIARGWTEPSDWVTCDGTLQQLTVRVGAGDIPFKHGTALVSARLWLVDYGGTWQSQFGEASPVVLRLH